MIASSRKPSSTSPAHHHSVHFAPLPTTILEGSAKMNRGGLSFFGAAVHQRTDKKDLSPPRRFSASHALEALRQKQQHQHDPALENNEDETKQEVVNGTTTTTTSSSNNNNKKRFSSPGNVLPSKIQPLVKDTLVKAAVTATPTVNDNASVTSAAERRRSSRKSVNGMVIEIDMEDEAVFEQCDDYVDDYKPDLTRTQSNESLEELRTRLEALENERISQQLPEHDEYGWGVQCMRKQLIEALESSSSLEKKGNASTSALKGIPEFEALGDDTDEDDNDDDEGSVPSQQARRSTVRSSVHGLVLEYNWSSGSESEGEDGEEIRNQKEC